MQKTLTPKKKTSPDFIELTCYIGGYTPRKGFVTSWENMPEKLMLVVSELAEAMEDWRDDNKKHFKREIADAFVRLFDIAYYTDMNVYQEIIIKMRCNETRPYRHGRKN